MIDNMVAATRYLNKVFPNTSWSITNDGEYRNFQWFTPDITKPTPEEFNAGIAEELLLESKSEYTRLRAKEYPPIEDYIDGVVKGDDTQVQAYISACLAVKIKHPKPE